MSTVETQPEPTADASKVIGFPEHRITAERYRKMVEAGIFADDEPISLCDGRLVERSSLAGQTGLIPHRMTVERYERLVEAGVFGEDEPIFLLDGRLVEKMTKGFRHSFGALKLNRTLDRLIPPEFHARLEQPIFVREGIMPEPDVAIVRGTLDDYRDGHPTVHDTALVVEVADSSVAEDQQIIPRVYASASIPVAWLVNIPRRRVEVFSEPSGPTEAPRYAKCVRHEIDAEIPVVLDGVVAGRILVSTLIA